MLHRKPAIFTEAIEAAQARRLLPSTGSALDLAALPAEIRERAVFSARTTHASHLSLIQDVTTRILDPDRVPDPDTGTPRPRRPGEYMDPAKARALLRTSLASLGYDPADIGAAPGSLKDLASTRRLDLIIYMQTRMARGYGQHQQGQTPAALDAFPAQELLRVYQRREPRTNWRSRFRAAGGTIAPDGRMIALKNSPVWTSLSRFGLPYPPFDYGSGMGVADVDRDTAERLGLITSGQRIAPQPRNLNENLSAPLSSSSASLVSSILAAMGPRVQYRAGVLHFIREVAA